MKGPKKSRAGDSAVNSKQVVKFLPLSPNLTNDFQGPIFGGPHSLSSCP